MACDDIPSLLDIQNTKKHVDDFGRLMGTGEGTSTNGVTGQVRPTYNKVIKDSGFKPGSGDFTTGFIVIPGQRDIAWYDPISKNWYSYLGVIPTSGYVVAPTTNPVGDSDWAPRTDELLRHELATSSGLSLVGFEQSGPGAILRNTEDKILEYYPSVVDYGATGTGDDTAAFTLAQNANKFIEIPEGMTFNVSPGLNYWQFFGRGSVSEPGWQWSLTPYPQTDSLGKHYVERTFGTHEQAVGQSITINSGSGQTKENTQVLGADTKGLAQYYTDRDHVAQYISAYSYIPDVLDATTTYTATSLTNSAISALNAAGKIKPGMIIDTQHATICTGRVQSVSGNTITVDVWWPRVGAAVTPANGTGAIINPNNKIFGQNIVVGTSGNGTTTGASKFAGIELDLFTPPSSSPVFGTWGYDMAVLGGYLDVGYQIRGKRNISFFSNNAGGGGLFGFRSVGDSRAVSIKDATSKAIEVVTGGSERFAVDPNGTTHIAGGAVHFIEEIQTTATFTSIGLPWVIGHGALFYITGFNPVNGREGKFVIAANNTSAGNVHNSDGTGALVEFRVSGNTLQIKATTGVYQFTAFQLLV